jgi:hypothetical protein
METTTTAAEPARSGVAVMFDALLTVRANLDWLVATKNAHYIAVIKKNRRIKRHCKQYVYVYRARRASRPRQREVRARMSNRYPSLAIKPSLSRTASDIRRLR